MKTKLAIFLMVSAVTACVSAPPPAAPVKQAPIVKKEPAKVETASPVTSTAWTHAGYQKALAERICEVNATKVYTGRPQALLRSVIVVKYTVDANGNLTRSDVIRTNHDHANQATALASLKNTSPFPKPAWHLLRNGHVEIMETWLFNNDGRFQLRTIALPQMSE
jgi:protein TonB